MGYHVINSWKRQKKSLSKKINEIIHVILTFGLGLYYPLLVLNFGEGNSGIVFATATEDFTFFGNLIIIGIVIFMFLWALSAKIRTIRNPELLMTTNNYELFCSEFLDNYGTKNKLRRKYIHTLPFGVVALIVIICYFLSTGLLGEGWLDYARFVIAIVGIVFAFTFIIGDLVRLLDFSFMPPIVANWFKKAMTKDEMDTFTSTSVMVFGFGPFLLFDFPIFLIILLITAVADAFASIFGLLAKKKHHFPKGSDKTIEGYIGGSLTAFLCTIFGVFFACLFGVCHWSLSLTFLIGGLLALVFFLIDIITTKIGLQDNFLNPLLCGIVLLLILILLDVSVF
jgi:dolichol kinase